VFEKHSKTATTASDGTCLYEYRPILRVHRYAEDSLTIHERRTQIGDAALEGRWSRVGESKGALRHSACDSLMQAACCVTTKGVEAARPSDDAWEAARAVCGVPGARIYKVRTGAGFAFASASHLFPVRAIRL
jgi:hypothetical protein